MNIFNKTLLAISLAVAIPLSTQAHWLGDLKNNILGKKKTLASSAVLGGALCIGSLKLVNWFYSSWPQKLSETEMLALHPHLNDAILTAAKIGFDSMTNTINTRKASAISLSLLLTLQLIYRAHSRNLFGENN